MTTTADQITGAELVERARALLPSLRERAARTEQERKVPSETIAAYQQAGLLRTLKPRRYGGHELSTAEHVNITMELASACGSSGWVFSLLCEHSWIISLFPREAQDEVWGENPDHVASASLHPERSRATRVPGGLKVSGKFPFSSGCDHADYVLVNANVEPADGGPAEVWSCLVPRGACSIEDDWFVIGLRGTGSKTILLDDVFVPEHRALRLADIEGRNAPGIVLHPRFAQLRVPRPGIAPLTHISSAVGIGQGAVDLFSELARGQSRRRAGQMDQSEVVQLKLAESAAEVFAAKLLVRNAAQEAIEAVRRGEEVPLGVQARFQRDGAFAGQLSMRAIDRLHVAYGARGIFDDNPLARSFRDIHTAIAQAGMKWESRGALYGRFRLGKEAGPVPGRDG